MAPPAQLLGLPLNLEKSFYASIFSVMMTKGRGDPPAVLQPYTARTSYSLRGMGRVLADNRLSKKVERRR